MYLGISEDVSRAKTNKSLKFHRDPPCLSAQMYLVLSKSGETNAWQRAIQLGPSLDEQYINAEGNQVVWTFERVLEVKVILEDRLGDGVEVFHRFLREDEVKSLAKPLSAP
jgi:hypothetical protein